MSSSQWYYQRRTGWRAWWKWCAPSLFGWLIAYPVTIYLHGSDWRWWLSVTVSQLFMICAVDVVAYALGAGPYRIEKKNSS